jgi:hypothetical protein
MSQKLKPLNQCGTRFERITKLERVVRRFCLVEQLFDNSVPGIDSRGKVGI